MSANARFGFIVEYVADVDAAKRFYTDVLGLEVERAHPTFIQFRDAAGVNVAIASDEAVGGGEPEVYWLVDDAEAAYRTLSGQAKVAVPLKQMPFGTLFGIEDPAGQTQYLLELAQNRPSQPVG